MGRKPSLAKRIQRARLATGLSQAELAERVDVSQPTISGWERGTAPRHAQLERLETVLGSLSGAAAEQAEVEQADGSAFGAWLTRARTLKGYSVARLAELSGISIPAIYAIESGKSANPQERTRARLEHALGEQVPEDVASEAAQDQGIEGLGSLEDFDPYAREELPTSSGVYVFYDVSDRPIYVGEGGNIRARVLDHEQKFWFKWPIVARASYIVIKDPKLRKQTEQILIKFLKSNAVINKQHVER